MRAFAAMALIGLCSGCIVKGPSDNDLTEDVIGQYFVGYVGQRLLITGVPCGNSAAPGETSQIVTFAITVDGNTANDWSSAPIARSITSDTTDSPAVDGPADIRTVQMVKSTTNLFVFLETGAAPSGAFQIRLRPAGGTGSNDDVVTLFPASSCGGLVAATSNPSGFEASFPLTCLTNTGPARFSSSLTFTSAGGDTAGCITGISW